jgi:hypothetical protein
MAFSMFSSFAFFSSSAYPRRMDTPEADCGALVDRTAVHAVLSRLVPTIMIKTVETEEFHDRFWIDPDAHKGLVMGTSLNGVTKKIALIDHLGREDVMQIAALARAMM